MNRLKQLWNKDLKHKAFIVAASFVVFFTTYALVLPAITLDEDTAVDEPGIAVETTIEETVNELETVYDPFIIEQEREEQLNQQKQEETVTVEGTEETAAAADVVTFFDDSTDVAVSVEAPAGAFPEGTVMVVTPIESEDVLDAISSTVDKVKRVQAVDISFYHNGQEIEPALPIKVSLVSDLIKEAKDTQVVHIDDEGNGTVVEQAESEDDEVVFESKDFSTYVVVETELETTVITADGETYKITVSYDETAKIPENAYLDVKEILPENEQYQGYVDDITNKLDTDLNYVRLFDISIMDGDKKLQPASKVAVRIELDDLTDDGLKAVHIPDHGEMEVLDVDVKEESAVEFETKGFSVYAVIGGDEPTARMQINFHIISYAGNEEIDTVLASIYVKKSDTAEELETILYDPGVGGLGEREIFRGWAFQKDFEISKVTKPYDADTNPDGGMTIEDIRDWVKTQQSDINENPMRVVDFYAVILKHYSVTYLDRFGVSIDMDTAYMLRNSDVAEYTINQTYETNDEDYHFKGWVTKDDESKITTDAELETVVVAMEGFDQGRRYNLYKNNTEVELSGDVVFRAHAPKGKWLIFHEVEKGATYTAPQFLEENESPVMPDPDHMLLLGYQFVGWYKNYNEATGEYSDLYTGSPIDVKTHVYAKWEPATWARYTVVIWKQNLNGTYAYAESIQLAGNVDTVISTTGTNSINQNQAGNYVLSSINNNDADYLVVNGVDYNHNTVSRNLRARHLGRTGQTHNYENPNYIGFNCVRIDEGITINPEGTAVVNVYYDRITYTIKVYHARSNGNNYQVATTRTGNNDNNDLGPGATDYGMNWTNTIRRHFENNAWVAGYQYNGPAADLHSETSGNYTYYYTTITAKYGENIERQWPSYSYFPNLSTSNNNNPGNNDTYGFVSWYMENDAGGYKGAGSGLNTFKGIISKMDEMLLGDITTAEGNLLFGRYDERDLYYYTYQIWLEALEGEDYSDYVTKTGTDGKTYYLGKEFVANSAASDPTKATQPPMYSGFTNISSMNKQPAPVNHVSTCEFYYQRVKNSIIYRDGSYFDGNGNRLSAYAPHGSDKPSDPIPYEQDLTSYNGGYNEQGVLVHGDDYYMNYPSSYEGFVFEGWYTDATCTTPYVFTTMPDASITVYAKFRQVQYRVFLKPNVPDGKIVDWGSGDQEMNFRGTYGTTISLPTGKLIVSEDTPEILDETYEFSGWYRDPQLKNPFDPDAYELTDALALPYDKTVDMTDYMDKYGNIQSGPNSEAPFNSDLTGNNGGNRWWIEKKIVLYGKWIKRMEAGTGIQVIYDPNGGSDEVKDDTLYKDGTNAIAQSAPLTSPTTTVGDETADKVFLYWVLQRWDETEQEYVDVEPLEFVYPGDTFTVSYQYARTIETHDPVTGEVIDTQYFVQLRAEYEDPERETPTHIWWYSNFGDNDVVKQNRTSSSAPLIEQIGINEAVLIKPESTFSRPGYTFLGWARVEVDDQHPATLHPELGYDDLFLRYENGKFYAEDSHGTWVEVTHVAADERLRYHDLYAVWARDVQEIKVYKYDTANVNKALEGAVFSLTGPDGTDISYTGLVTNADGYLVFDVSDGSTILEVPVSNSAYTLLETQAPNGYVAIAGDITFTVTQSMVTGSGSGYSVEAEVIEGTATGVYIIKVQNSSGIELPSTGGSGTARYLVLGAILMTGSLLFENSMMRRKRKGGK
jgi:uncharacterized repeat protein (TIGR02543 family)